ncbi:TetR family transcriptional regulator [Epidermidibacterium keratini]
MTLGLRDQKKLETRARLAQAAMTLVTERGYPHVTIADIADAAGVSRRTFSNYFSSKAECLIEINEAEAARVLPMILADTSDQPIGKRVASALADFSDSFWDDCARLYRLREEEPEVLSALARAEVQHGAEFAADIVELSDGVIDPLRMRVTIAAVQAAVMACLGYWLDSGSPGGTRGLADLIEQTLSVVDLSWLDDYRELVRDNLAARSER